MDYSLLLCFEPIDELSFKSDYLTDKSTGKIMNGKNNCNHIYQGLNTSIFSSKCVDVSNGQYYVFYLGIIDLLQKYGFKKSSEHKIRSFYEDGKKISIVKPEYYRTRFIQFLERFYMV